MLKNTNTTPPTEQSDFLKVAVKCDIKRKIDIIAAIEGRAKYLVVADMVAAYEMMKVEKLKSERLPRVTKKNALAVGGGLAVSVIK